MKTLRLTLLLVCAALAVKSHAALKPEDVKVTTNAAPAGVRAIVEISAGQAGEQYLDVTLVNESQADIALAQASVELPWVPADKAGLLISMGGTEMGDSRPQVREPSANDIKTGAYFLARHADGCALLGLVTWNTFWTKLSYQNGRVLIEADGEGRRLRPGEKVAMDKIRLAEDANWQDALYTHADRIAHFTGAKPRKPMNYVGWGTWDYFGRTWRHEDVIANTDALLKLYPQANLLQIDGGWWPFRGDYGLLKDSLPKDSLKTLASYAKSKGLVAGLHLDGMRGDMNSQVAKEHPDYFLHDQHGKFFVFPQPNDGDLLHHVYFDFSNPAACDYMRSAIANIRRNWGFDYIKIDFLRFGVAEKMLRVTKAHGPAGRVIKAYDPGLTSVERVRRGMKAFREGMGDDAYFLGCSAVFGLTFGFVDGLRTGDDVYTEYPHFKRLGVENGGNFYLHGRVVFNDADYNIVRGPKDQDERLVKNSRKDSKLTFNEVQLWSHYVGLFGGPKINSDDLTILGEERAKLFKLAAALPVCDRYVPIDFWSHARHQQDPASVFLGEAGGKLYLAVFNWSDDAREIRVTAPDAATWAHLNKLDGVATTKLDQGTVAFSLPARHSSIYEIDAEISFDQLRKALSVK